ncbi:hypothetical protein NDU88_005145 [Pleurodeles waltl]|uniref:Secreted protein n=1 Tax=Pleurodeles waltl TaxID=8319 RepID=A0AAV7RK77_PLEWA|nr:hypothetical protein NDU88_005145 [Pleurodeles waltl]
MRKSHNSCLRFLLPLSAAEPLWVIFPVAALPAVQDLHPCLKKHQDESPKACPSCENERRDKETALLEYA